MTLGKVKLYIFTRINLIRLIIVKYCFFFYKWHARLTTVKLKAKSDLRKC